MHGYGDLRPRRFKDPPFFVITCLDNLQQSKIEALGFAIDKIDQPDRLDEQGLFQDIMTRHGFAPDELFVIGDSADSEIAAGNALNIPTVQTAAPASDAQNPPATMCTTSPTCSTSSQPSPPSKLPSPRAVFIAPHP